MMSQPGQKAVYTIYRIIKSVLSVLPRRGCLAFGRTLGFLIYFLDAKHRKIALKNLAVAFGHSLPFPARKKLAKGSFLHFGQVFIDLIKFSTLSHEKREALLTVSGGEHLEGALQKGKGALIVTAHYGNWEIGILGLSRYGKVNAIARALDNAFIDEELRDLRNSFGAQVIYKNQATRQTLRALKENTAVAIVIDQNVLREQAIFVDFFGKSAATTPALATFHLRTQAAVIPAFCFPTPAHKYHLQLLKPLRITLSGDHDKDVAAITQACTHIIENQIRHDPQYWLWFHDRWRTQSQLPPLESGKI